MGATISYSKGLEQTMEPIEDEGTEEHALPPKAVNTDVDLVLEEREEREPEGLEELKTVTLETAPYDVRFPSPNQSKRCYAVYCEFHKCLKDQDGDDSNCRRLMRTYRSICPDEWIENWNQMREDGTWFGKW